MGAVRRWKPDGWDATTRIGVLAPHADVRPEAELGAMAPSMVTIHASDQAKITPAGLHAWVTEHTPPDADAVAIGGNGFRAVGAIHALEQDLDRPVVTANQALMWAALSAAGTDSSSITGYGRLFDQGPR